MDRLSLKAQERIILGKKVKNLRKDGKLPGHVFGKGIETEHVTVDKKEFLKVFHLAGETGLIDLKIGAEKVKPVLIREVQHDPISGDVSHIDFYQVNLTQKVTVPIPLVLIGEQPEAVKLGEAIVLQTLNEVSVEALPADLVEKIEIDITPLKAIDDAINVSQLNYDHSKLTIHAEGESVVVKLAQAVSAETAKLLEEQAAEAAAAQAETEEGAEKAEGEQAAKTEDGVTEGEALEAKEGEGGEEVKKESSEPDKS